MVDVASFDVHRGVAAGRLAQNDCAVILETAEALGGGELWAGHDRITRAKCQNLTLCLAIPLGGCETRSARHDAKTNATV